jgi:hypothetical protein
MKGQKGQALLLVLAFLAVGSLLIAPALNYTFSGLRAVDINERALTRMYDADSAIEDALWKLLNEYLGTFNTSSPEIIDSFTTEAGKNAHISITIPSVPAAEDLATGGGLHHLTFEVVPNWLDPPPEGETSTVSYIMRIQMNSFSMTKFVYTLPKGMTYVSGSSYDAGPMKQALMVWTAPIDFGFNPPHVSLKDNGVWVDMTSRTFTIIYAPAPVPFTPTVNTLFITTADGRQTLDFRPVYSGSGNWTLVSTFKAQGTPPWGINYVEPAVFVGGFGTIIDQQSAALGVSMYTILIVIDGVTYQVVVGYDTATGKFNIVSYQVVG